MEGLRRALLAQAQREGNVNQQRELKKQLKPRPPLKSGSTPYIAPESVRDTRYDRNVKPIRPNMNIKEIREQEERKKLVDRKRAETEKARRDEDRRIKSAFDELQSSEPTQKEKIEQGEVYTQADEQREKDKNFFASLMTDEEHEYFKQERIEQLADAPDEPYEDEYGSIPYQIRKLKEEFGGDEWGFTGTPPHKIYDGVVYFYEEDSFRLYDVVSGEDIGTWDGDGNPAVWDTEEEEAEHQANIKKYTLGSEKK
jgi:hypothetical protein